MEKKNIDEAKEDTEYKTLTFDVEEYQSFLDDVDISDDQKQEFLETFWNIMVQFVDMGFGIEATQLAVAHFASDQETPKQNDADQKTTNQKNEKEIEVCR